MGYKKATLELSFGALSYRIIWLLRIKLSFFGMNRQVADKFHNYAPRPIYFFDFCSCINRVYQIAE